MFLCHVLPRFIAVLMIGVGGLVPAPQAGAGEGLTKLEIGELVLQAGDYGRSAAGVGVVVLVGDDGVQRSYSPEIVGQSFVNLFGQQGVPAKAFVGYSGTRPTAILFTSRLGAFGPFGVKRAMEHVNASVQAFEREKRVAELALDLAEAEERLDELQAALIEEFGRYFVLNKAALYN